MAASTTGAHMLFDLGTLVATPGALGALDDEGVTAIAYVNMHLNGQWGDLADDDKKANDDAVKHGDRILSAYVLPRTKARIWLITEQDRSHTTILLPSDY